MSRNDEREQQATKTATDSSKTDAKKREQKKPTDTLSDENPLICRGMD